MAALMSQNLLQFNITFQPDSFLRTTHQHQTFDLSKNSYCVVELLSQKIRQNANVFPVKHLHAEVNVLIISKYIVLKKLILLFPIHLQKIIIKSF